MRRGVHDPLLDTRRLRPLAALTQQLAFQSINVAVEIGWATGHAIAKCQARRLVGRSSSPGSLHLGPAVESQVRQGQRDLDLDANQVGRLF